MLQDFQRTPAAFSVETTRNAGTPWPVDCMDLLEAFLRNEVIRFSPQFVPGGAQSVNTSNGLSLWAGATSEPRHRHFPKAGAKFRLSIASPAAIEASPPEPATSSG